MSITQTGVPFINGRPDPHATDGIRRSLFTIDRGLAMQVIADRFITAGGRYLCETLENGRAHLMAIIDVDGRPELVAEETSMNGPLVPFAVDRLVKASGAHLNRTDLN